MVPVASIAATYGPSEPGHAWIVRVLDTLLCVPPHAPRRVRGLTYLDAAIRVAIAALLAVWLF